MARLVKSGATPVTSIVIQTILMDGSTLDAEYSVGDLITNLRYIENQEIKTITGKLSKVNFNNLQTVRNYGVASTLRSYFADDVLPVSIDIDCSEQYASKVITVPCNEIVEDAGVENVKRMKTYMKYGARFTSFLTNMDENDFTILEGQDINGLVYMERGGDVTSDVRVVAFTYDANLVPLTMIVVENGLTKIIDIMAIKDMGAVIPTTTVDDNINDVLANSETGMVALAAGKFETPMTLTKNTTIRGAWAGINAVERKNNPEAFGEETVISGTITIPQGTNLVLDGVSLSKDARIVATEAEDVELKNVIVDDLTPNGKNSFVVYVPNSEKPTKLVIKNSYFGPNSVDTDGNKIKNGFELAGPIADGSIISGCYFAKGVARNNAICFYHVEDGATITVRDCVFEESINAVRVGTMGDVEVHYEFINNTYNATLEGDYAGFLLIQPYSNKTISMAKNVIRIAGIVNNTDQEQLYYVYYNPKDTHMTPDILPTLIIDGKVVMAPTTDTE